MGIGAKIKWTRLDQDMTQENLAEGIVSMSYLSKIENERTTPSVDIVEMLCARLGIEADIHFEKDIAEKLDEWYDLLREMKDKKKIQEIHDEIEFMIEENKMQSVLLFEIHKIKYYLIFSQENEALVQINKLKNVSETLDKLQKYYWYKFRANYNSLTNDFPEALRLYKLAEENLNRIDVNDEEKADTYYSIAVTTSKLRQTIETIDYTKIALDIYQKVYNFVRCGHCHILLGITYRRLKMYDNALKNQRIARHLGETTNNKQIIQLSNQNLGYLYSLEGNAELAIKYYKEVVNSEGITVIDKIVAAISLIREYHSIKELDKAREMVDLSTELLESTRHYSDYDYFYYVIYTHDYSLKEDHKSFETLVKDEFLPFLRKKKDYASLVTYSNLLAEHYEKQHKYKEASKYFKMANINYQELIDV